MPTVTNSVEIKASPDDVWAVLADLPATRHWLPGTVDARMDQDVRVCRMTDGQEIHERISDLDPDRRSYRFEHLMTAAFQPGTGTVIDCPAHVQVPRRGSTGFRPEKISAQDHLSSAKVRFAW